MQRDSFFWLGEINKATIVHNHAEHLLSDRLAKKAAKGLRQVLAGETRVSRVIDFEPLLIAAAGPEVTMIHAGRSSQDMHSTTRAAIIRDDTLRLMRTFDRVLGTLLQLANQHIDTIVPNYTNGVAAQPNSYAHELLGYYQAFIRDRARLQEFYDRYNQCPMGATVLNGTGWPLPRTKMAASLGFAQARDNALDCTAFTPVDMPIELASIMGHIGIHIGMMINSIMVQYAQPRPWIILQEGGENTYVSSAMPQKRNPGIMNTCREDASDLVGEMTTTYVRAHNVVPGMMDGKSNKKNTLFVDKTIQALDRFEKILRALRINPERALEELNSDWTATQEIADRLMKNHGLPFRVGHHVASRMVSIARREGLTPLTFPYSTFQRVYTQVINEEWPEGNATCPMTEREFHQALDPREIIKHRVTLGSAAPAEVTRMLSQAQEQLAAFAQQTAQEKDKIEKALATLQTQFSAIVSL